MSSIYAPIMRNMRTQNRLELRRNCRSHSIGCILAFGAELGAVMCIRNLSASQNVGEPNFMWSVLVIRTKQNCKSLSWSCSDPAVVATQREGNRMNRKVPYRSRLCSKPSMRVIKLALRTPVQHFCFMYAFTKRLCDGVNVLVGLTDS